MPISPFNSVILAILEEEVENLFNDLDVLRPRLEEEKAGVFITHNGEDIVVYGPLKFKAYIPKKYNGWKVLFVESNGDELQLDLDISIST